MPSPVIALPSLEHEAVAVRFEQYLERWVDTRDRSAVRELYRRLPRTVDAEAWPTSTAQLLASNKSPTAKFFGQERASRPTSQERTARWDEDVLRDPYLRTAEAMIVDMPFAKWSGGGGWVFKAGLVLGAGIQPVDIARVYAQDERLNLLVGRVRKLFKAGHRGPVVTTHVGKELTETMVLSAITQGMPWTGRVANQFTFPGYLRIRWLGDAKAEGPLQFFDLSDGLAGGTPAEDGADGAFAWIEVNRKHHFLAYGPSLRRSYYLRYVPVRGDGPDEQSEQAQMVDLVEMIEARDLALDDFAIERLKVHRDKSHAYERLTRGILLAWRFALHAPTEIGRGDITIPEAN